MLRIYLNNIFYINLIMNNLSDIDNDKISSNPIKLSSFDFQQLSNPNRNNDESESPVNQEYNIDLSDDDDDDEEDNEENYNDINDDEDIPDLQTDFNKTKQFNEKSFNNNNNNNNNNNSDSDSDGDSDENNTREVSSDEEENGEEGGDEEYEQVPKKPSEYPDVPPQNYSDRSRFKQEMLVKLMRLEKQGYEPSKRFTLASSYDDILFEYRRLKRQRSVEKSIKFSRNILLTIISGIEFLNNKFDPLSIKLKGWSQEIMGNISDYDEVFEELHDKYGESVVNMPPEIKLLMMIAGSAFMFHLSNSLFSSATPDLQDILRQNPDIMDNITKAAMDKMQTSGTLDMSDPIDKMMVNGANMKLQKKNELDTMLNNLKSGTTGPVQKNNMKVFDKKNVNGISLNL